MTTPETWYYSGSNLVRKFPADLPTATKPAATSSPAVTHSYDFNGDLDSNTNGSFLDPHFRIAWLAFCSGPFLSRPHREIPMPNVFWKEFLHSDHETPPIGFPDKTLQFKDGLALPISIEVFTKAGQPLFQYHVKHGRGPHVVTTNLLGWEFPREFRCIQYLPIGGAKDKSRWQANLTAHGTLTSIKVASSPPRLSLDAPPAARRFKTYDSYEVKAGGPAVYNVITNSPALNKAKIFLSRRQDNYDRISFTVTNAEPSEILLWNVRVQVKSPAENPGTDGFGWDTIDDDYPSSKEAAVKSGHATELTVKAPNAALWRVCLLYSKRDTNSPPRKTYSGNYEIISEPIDEATLDKLEWPR
jgi:hypothetical protein